MSQDASRTASAGPYLQVRDLRVHFPTEDGIVRAVDGITFSVERGKTLGIVGESGSGKSVTSMSILALHDSARAHISGEISVGGRNIVGMDDEQVRTLRGKDMSMIFQDPLSALHPYYKVGAQISEAFLVHHPSVGKAAAKKRAIEMLDRVGIPQPQRRAEQYPHEFSGGMRQRAMIAMALVNDPALLIADEPTTALDVMVMYGGRAIESGTVQQVMRRPQHPYTWGLLASVPSLHGDAGVDLVPIKGNPPSLINLPAGCAFHPRCRYAGRNGNRSFSEVPELRPAGEAGHLVACHLPEGERRRYYSEDIAHAGVAL